MSIMTISLNAKLTTEALLRAALVFALIDLAVVPFLNWRLQPARFRQLKWPLVLTAAIFWYALWTWALDWAWEPVYRYVFVDWLREWLPLIQSAHFAVITLVFWWSASRLTKCSVAVFCLLGGFWGMVTHTWAVYLGIVDKPPLLQGASSVAAVIFAIFEFMFYWCLILIVAWLLEGVLHSMAEPTVKTQAP